jgi:hypothetical protein
MPAADLVAKAGKAENTEVLAVRLLRLIRKSNRNRTTRQSRSGMQHIVDATQTALRQTRALPSRPESYFSVYATRQMVFDPSSVTSSDPSGATVIPTGRPQTLPLGSTNPVTKSSYSPLAWPVWCNGTRITS